MRAIWVLARKDFRLLLRDRVAAVLLVGMPLLFILILGLLLGEGFGQKPDDTLRVSVVALDEGPCPIPDPARVRERFRAVAPPVLGLLATPAGPWLAAAALPPADVNYRTWADVVLTDLKETPGIRIEIITSREQAERLIRNHRRSAILVLQPDFSARVNRCSFLDLYPRREVRITALGLAAAPNGPWLASPVLTLENYLVNPFHREGVHLDLVGASLLKDDNQVSAASIIEQVVQVTMLRVILPFMIGQAFDKMSEPRFINRLGQAVRLPMPRDFKGLVQNADSLLKNRRVIVARGLDRTVGDGKMDKALTRMEAKLKEFRPLVAQERIQLSQMIDLASGKDEKQKEEFQAKVGDGVQRALEGQFSKYNLTGKTWSALTKSQGDKGAAQVSGFTEREGTGLLRRGAHRYQVLVPSYTVMFSFFLVLVVGWVFVVERRQGTLLRLRAAPLTRAQVLLGKLLPCFAVSLLQGAVLLIAGRLLFGMRWGPDSWSFGQQAGWLALVVFSTSLAAMGLALLVAALARTEMQVAIFGALPVLVLALIGGCVLPREMMPEQTQKLALFTPHGWALSAYRELLNASPTYEPNLDIVLRACGVLCGLGVGFLALAWGLLRLD
jgi:ABC-type Na+ efflux pump permease subunit